MTELTGADEQDGRTGRLRGPRSVYSLLRKRSVLTVSDAEDGLSDVAHGNELLSSC